MLAGVYYLIKAPKLYLIIPGLRTFEYYFLFNGVFCFSQHYCICDSAKEKLPTTEKNLKCMFHAFLPNMYNNTGLKVCFHPAIINQLLNRKT